MDIKNVIKTFGPGILFAGAAVGVSHLVQSTRAGANYGFELLWVVIIANLSKYPFMEFATRYAAATGDSLIEGYAKIGKWALILYVVLTFATMFAIQAAVSLVTAGLVANVFHLNMNHVAITAIILFLTMIVLGIGHYGVLDKMSKLIVVALALSTIIAVVFAFDADDFSSLSGSPVFNWTNRIDVLFLIAFIGWMPAPIDVSVWQSLWSVAKEKQLGFRPTLKQSLADFNAGYIGAAVLAVGFLSLGAFIMHGTGEQLSPKGDIFAGQLINMYTQSIGQWAYYLIAVAAITTMFSTTLTCLDAYPRILRMSTILLTRSYVKLDKFETRLYWLWLMVVVFGTLFLIFALSGTMRFMVDLATTISFVTAPVLAILNYIVIRGKDVPKWARPKRWLRIYAWLGIIFLCAFSLFYILYEFFKVF